MTDTEQPSQWARELWERARLEYFHGDPLVCRDERAALQIQRAFAEREAELVGENAKLRGAFSVIAAFLHSHAGKQTLEGDAFKIADTYTATAALAALKGADHAG